VAYFLPIIKTVGLAFPAESSTFQVVAPRVKSTMRIVFRIKMPLPNVFDQDGPCNNLILVAHQIIAPTHQFPDIRLREKRGEIGSRTHIGARITIEKHVRKTTAHVAESGKVNEIPVPQTGFQSRVSGDANAMTA